MVLTLLRRLLAVAPILLVVSALLFTALRILPVDPAAMSMPPNATNDEIAAARRDMGLDRPLPEQYAIWLGRTLHGDLGRSIHFRRDVGGLLAETLPATIELTVAAMLIAGTLGLGGGLLLFTLRDTAAEPVAETATTVLMSIPEFLWALLLIFVFGVLLSLLPFTGQLDAGLRRPTGTGFLLLDSALAGRADILASVLSHLLLPALALGLAFAVPIMRVLRASLLEAYHDDYIHQAQLRGTAPSRVLLRHALPNAILPTLNLTGVQFGFLFGGSLLVEVIFSYPGMGNLMVDAVRNADLPIIQAVGLTYCIVVLLINAAVDAATLALDPRLSRA